MVDFGLVRDFMAHLDEYQRATAAALFRHIDDARAAQHRFADGEWLMELEPAAGPHAARQRHRRQEAAAARVAVVAEFAVPVQRQEVQPVPQRRQGVAGEPGAVR
jgi:hypothetical protein